MHRGRSALFVALLVGSTFVLPTRAVAQTKTVTPAAQAEAETHFQKARALYKSGNYHEAIDELKDMMTSVRDRLETTQPLRRAG